MMALAAELSRIAGQAFPAEGLAESFGHVQLSDRPDLAPFQCNGALAAAKAAKANPRAIAEKVASRLRREPLFSDVQIAGPGFINLNLKDEWSSFLLWPMLARNFHGTPFVGSGVPEWSNLFDFHQLYQPQKLAGWSNYLGSLNLDNY